MSMISIAKMLYWNFGNLLSVKNISNSVHDSNRAEKRTQHSECTNAYEQKELNA